MMTPEQVEQLIRAGLQDIEELRVTGDGSHFHAVIVTRAFEGQSPVKRQQMVYATVSEQIASGELHALAMDTYTPEQWAQVRDGA